MIHHKFKINREFHQDFKGSIDTLQVFKQHGIQVRYKHQIENRRLSVYLDSVAKA